MTTQTSTVGATTRSGGLWRAAGIATILAVVINQAIRLIAVALLRPDPGFLPLTIAAPAIIFTVLGMIGATFVYWLTTRFSQDPARLFRTIAWVALALSLIPNILSGLDPQSMPFPGGNWPNLIALMIMHLPPALLSIFLLPRR